MPLIMCVNNNDASCLYIAAENGHAAAAQVGEGGGRQREAGGRVSAATAHMLTHTLSTSLSHVQTLAFTAAHARCAHRTTHLSTAERVSAATAHGTWCRGCRQHTATRDTTLQHTTNCCSVR